MVKFIQMKKCAIFSKKIWHHISKGEIRKIFRNFIGPRNASKSKVIELLQLALENIVDLPSDSITLNK